MKRIVIILTLSLTTFFYAFVSDYVQYAKVYINNGQIGKIQYDSKSLSISNFMEQDTLTISIHSDTGNPENGMLILIDSTVNRIVIYDEDDITNERRWNGKKYSVQFKTLEKLKMNKIDVFHSDRLWDSLDLKPLFYGRIEINRTLPNKK